MKRKTCKQSKDSNPNWLEKVLLPDLNKLDYNITECFTSLGDKVVKFEDRHLSCCGKCVSYSCSVKKQISSVTLL